MCRDHWAGGEARERGGKCEALFNNRDILLFPVLTGSSRVRIHSLVLGGHQAIHEGSTPMIQTHPNRPQISTAGLQCEVGGNILTIAASHFPLLLPLSPSLHSPSLFLSFCPSFSPLSLPVPLIFSLCPCLSSPFPLSPPHHSPSLSSLLSSAYAPFLGVLQGPLLLSIVPSSVVS